MAQQKPAGKPIKITLTEQQISDIIQRAAKTRRSVRVESLEDRIAPSRIGLPIFGGAEGDVDPKLDDGGGLTSGDPDAFLGTSDDGGYPTTDGTSGPGTFVSDTGDDATPPDNFDPNAPILPPEGGEVVPPEGEVVDGGPEVILTPDAPPEDVIEQPTLDDAASVEFNENLHMQGDAPDGLSAEEMEEHRLNILRQLRGQG